MYGSDYKLKKAILNQEIFFIEKGIYSDELDNYTSYEIVLKKYDKAFLVKDSALHFLGFVKEESEMIHLGTARNAVRIKDKRVKQHFYSNLDKDVLLGKYGDGINHILCSGNIRSFITENQNEIRFWDLQALLFDLVRDIRMYSKQELLGILTKFRDCSVFTEFDYWDFEENFYNENLLYDRDINKAIEEIDSYVRDRRFKKEFDLEWL